MKKLSYLSLGLLMPLMSYNAHCADDNLPIPTKKPRSLARARDAIELDQRKVEAPTAWGYLTSVIKKSPDHIEETEDALSLLNKVILKYQFRGDLNYLACHWIRFKLDEKITIHDQIEFLNAERYKLKKEEEEN